MIILDPGLIQSCFFFSLHTKVTVVILVTFSLVVTAQQFIGDPIDCIVTKDVPAKMMDTYCWSRFLLTFLFTLQFWKDMCLTCACLYMKIWMEKAKKVAYKTWKKLEIISNDFHLVCILFVLYLNYALFFETR